MAVHHVASNIWPDLSEKDVSPDRGNKLLKALVARGSPEAIKEVAWYNQSRETVKLPPECYAACQQTGQQRLNFIKMMGDPELEERLKGLFTGDA